jgi:hypothetical protein
LIRLNSVKSVLAQIKEFVDEVGELKALFEKGKDYYHLFRQRAEQFIQQTDSDLLKFDAVQI